MKPRYPVWIVVDIPGLKKLELEFGPLVPVAIVHRLVKRSKTRVYDLVKQGRLRSVNIMGLMFTPQKDVEKIWPDK